MCVHSIEEEMGQRLRGTVEVAIETVFMRGGES